MIGLFTHNIEPCEDDSQFAPYNEPFSSPYEDEINEQAVVDEKCDNVIRNNFEW